MTGGGLNLIHNGGLIIADSTNDTNTFGLSVVGNLSVATNSPMTINSDVSGTMTVTLAAEGATAADDLIINALVDSTASSVSLIAGDTVTIGAAGDVSAATTIEIYGGRDYNGGGTELAGYFLGSVIMDSASTVIAGTDVTIAAPENISVSSVTGANISVTAADNTYGLANNSGFSIRNII